MTDATEIIDAEIVSGGVPLAGPVVSLPAAIAEQQTIQPPAKP